MSKINPEHCGFSIYENWHCGFPVKNLNVNIKLQEIEISEPRIEQMSKRLNVKGARIIELGCLEGMHSLILQRLGAKEIIAVEARKENFLKCLIVKNAFNLDSCKFLFGDLNLILSSLSGGFDLCLALGILYHLRDPVSVIYRIAQLAASAFVWTHYSTEEFPQGPLVKIRHNGCVYRGKYVKEDTGYYLSGLQEKSFWIFEDDILKAVKEAGFNNVELIQKERHEHGPAMTFLASK